MAFSLLSKKSKEELFWEWFSKNSVKYFHFENNQEKLFRELKYELNRIDSNLAFEFSFILPDGKREFIISANGIKSSFDSVRNLVDNAPEFEQWNIIAFKPPKKEIEKLQYKDILFNINDFFFTYTKGHGKIDLELYIKGFYESPEWTSICFIVLDIILGEYDTETYISGINKQQLKSKSGLLPIKELPNIVNEYKLELNN